MLSDEIAPVELAELVELVVFAWLVMPAAVLSVLAVLVAPAESSRLRVGDDEQLETRNVPITKREIVWRRDLFSLRSNINPRRMPIRQCARDVCINVKLCI